MVILLWLKIFIRQVYQSVGYCCATNQLETQWFKTTSHLVTLMNLGFVGQICWSGLEAQWLTHAYAVGGRQASWLC